MSPLLPETRWSERGKQTLCVKKDRGEVVVTVRGSTYLTVILLLQRCLQSSSVNAEISWGAQLHVLHQIDLDKHRSLWTTVLTAFRKLCFSWLFCFNRVFLYCIATYFINCHVIQFTRTFDFLESVMRYFSYCSMLKIKLGMAFVSRRSFAFKKEGRI